MAISIILILILIMIIILVSIVIVIISIITIIFLIYSRTPKRCWLGGGERQGGGKGAHAFHL